MRILLDLQGAQASGRFRGVGRYALSLARAMLQAPRGHEFSVALNGLMADSAADIADDLAQYLPRKRIISLTLPGPIQEIAPGNLWRTRAAEVLREAALGGLRPDVIHVSSLFEGIGHEAATSVNMVEHGVATAVTLFDLIPLLDPENYLADGRVRRWYLRKLQSLRRSDLLLAISHASAEDAVNLLEWPKELVPVIGAGVDPVFRPLAAGTRDDQLLALRHGLTRRAVMYAGGGDQRKNLGGLIQAFAQLDPELRARHQLVVVGELAQAENEALQALAAGRGLRPDELRLLGYVSDADLVGLYGLCAAFVFPSLLEGFGLPAAEAMACGAPVIGSATSSVPEIIGLPEALFDPRKPADIARVLCKVLSNANFAARLRAHGIARARAYSWNTVAAKTIDALEGCRPRTRPDKLPLCLGKLSLVCVTPSLDDTSGAILRGLASRYDVIYVVPDAHRWLNAVGDPIPSSIDLTVKSEAWFRDHAKTHGRVLHVISDRSDDEQIALFRACPGTVLLLGRSPSVAAFSAAALYREHGLSAVAAAARDGIARAPASYPIVGEFLTLGQGVILTDASLAAVITRCYGDRTSAAIQIEVDASAEACALAIERFSADLDVSRYRTVTAALASLPQEPSPTPADWRAVAASLSTNLDWYTPSRLLIDVTQLSKSDIGTGIQRVTRTIAAELIAAPPDGYKIELVRTTEDGVVLARRYAAQFLDLKAAADVDWVASLGEDELFIPRRGDVFLGLDLNFQISEMQEYIRAARNQGVTVLFVVYDLLPVTMPEMFGADVGLLYSRWLAAVTTVADGLLCISRSVADELRSYIDQASLQRSEPFRIGWFHQGTKLPAAAHSTDLDPDYRFTMDAMRRYRSVLAVGTIEPRKGYRQVLDAFDLLWASGADVSLTIVGNRGWLVDDLLTRLDSHPERGRRLFWLTGIPDTVLAELYKAADLLLAASVGEGFGLPLLEAGQFGLPVLARDLPVFREVLGDEAKFFDTTDPSSLAERLAQWAKSIDHRSTTVTRATRNWSDSRNQLVRHLFGDWYLIGGWSSNGIIWTKLATSSSH